MQCVTTIEWLLLHLSSHKLAPHMHMHGRVQKHTTWQHAWVQAGPLSGSLPDNQMQRFKEFGQWIKNCYGDANMAAQTSGNTTSMPSSTCSRPELVIVVLS